MQDQHLAAEVLNQLQRDLNKANLPELLFPAAVISYETLHPALAEFLAQVMNTSVSNYINFLYLIDIPENALNRSLKLRSEENMEGVVADLVLLREMQKVLLRRQFKLK